MSGIDETIVREYFELNGFLVRQLRKYQVQSRAKRTEEEIDLIVYNPAWKPSLRRPNFILFANELPLIRRAVVFVKPWHSQRFSPGTLRGSADISKFLENDVLKSAEQLFNVSEESLDAIGNRTGTGDSGTDRATPKTGAAQHSKGAAAAVTTNAATDGATATTTGTTTKSAATGDAAAAATGNADTAAAAAKNTVPDGAAPVAQRSKDSTPDAAAQHDTGSATGDAYNPAAVPDEGPLTKILVLPSLPTHEPHKTESIRLLQNAGLDAIISFRSMLQDLLGKVEVNHNYSKSDFLQTLRLLKNYDMVKSPQMELFKTLK